MDNSVTFVLYGKPKSQQLSWGTKDLKFKRGYIIKIVHVMEENIK